ncbi:DUF1549 and DUF1553 domain-containing protein [Verrucomicrobia bacterium]|nr:DUF1549 and DUF1553 domain-containing protein [Verrucomicrobiota bacterium]
MNDSTNMPKKHPLLKNAVLGSALAVVTAVVASQFFQPHSIPTIEAAPKQQDSFDQTVAAIDAEFEAKWKEEDLAPTPPADNYTIARRISLSLTGTIPSYQEIQAIKDVPDTEFSQRWLTHLMNDRRYADYVAERFTRVYVGTENGPFLQYRRRRMAEWLGDQFEDNVPYDQLSRSLIQAKGIWTSKPEVNFITVSIDQNNDKKGPDEVKLAARLTRAFLGVRIDCVQCHDDKFGDRWKQEDFHQLASFFANTELVLTGVRDNKELDYEFRYKGTPAETKVPQVVPFQPELMPTKGAPRERLAAWVTHPENKAFARTAVNRTWALMFNQPLITPIDDIPLQGPYPPGMEPLTRDFIENGYDIQRLIRLIVASRPFQLDSRTHEPNSHITPEHEEHYATFPLTRLRPEQVAGSVYQSASLTTVDTSSHVISRLTRAGQTGEFLKRYGDMGEDEFGEATGTIPQRLLLMNGKLVHERTKNDMVNNAATRIGALAISDEVAVEKAYITILTRKPTSEESSHFTKQLREKEGKDRGNTMQDICWALINATEFSWNH